MPYMRVYSYVSQQASDPTHDVTTISCACVSPSPSLSQARNYSRVRSFLVSSVLDCATPLASPGASAMQLMMVAIYTLLVFVMGCSEARADDSKLISYCYTTGH